MAIYRLGIAFFGGKIIRLYNPYYINFFLTTFMNPYNLNGALITLK